MFLSKKISETENEKHHDESCERNRQTKFIGLCFFCKRFTY